MARKQITTYICDGCGRECGRHDLRKFVLSVAIMSGSTRDYVAADLCDDCEKSLFVVVDDLFAADVDLPAMHRLVKT